MKKKDMVLIAIISVILSGFMIFFNSNKQDNVILDKTQEISSKDDEKKNDTIIVTQDENSNDVTNKKVVVYISGEVKNPQVVEMKIGDRLIDAIEKCGGMTQEADKDMVNLALLLKDEDHYVVPKKGEAVQTVHTDTKYNINSKNSGLVNINTADKTLLTTLPSIGEKTAERIIQYRETNGKFQSIEDIKNVNGIGDKKFEQIKDLITI